MANGQVGTLRESALHAQIKAWYGTSEDQFEVKVDDYLVDIVKGDMLVEIQTSHFQSIRNKLLVLLDSYPVRLVYPVAMVKWVLRYSSSDKLLSKRRSPRHGRPEHIFEELIYIPALPLFPRFSIELLLIEQEDVWVDDGKGSWRRKFWSIQDRRLLKVTGSQLLTRPGDYLAYLPENLPARFTSLDVANQSKMPRKLANNMLYCLLRMNLVKLEGTQNRSRLYSIIV